jgi:hypothetical protein
MELSRNPKFFDRQFTADVGREEGVADRPLLQGGILRRPRRDAWVGSLA